MRSDDHFLDRLTAHVVDDESCNEVAQIEPAVEAIGEGGQVVPGVLAVVQRMERPGTAVARDICDELRGDQCGPPPI